MKKEEESQAIDFHLSFVCVCLHVRVFVRLFVRLFVRSFVHVWVSNKARQQH